MKKLSTTLLFLCCFINNLFGQITLTGSNTNDGTYTAGNYVTTSFGITWNLAPSTFDAGTTYYHGYDQVVSSYTYFASTIFVVRQGGTWVLQKLNSFAGGEDFYTTIYHTAITYSGNNPPCNAWWIRNSDNAKIAIQISGTSCSNSCSPASALTVSKIGSECVTSSVSLSASACSGTYRWDTGETTAAISPNANKTYYVSCDNGTSCPSLLANGTINYPAILAMPSISSNAAPIVEPNTSITLTANCVSPGTVKWEDNSTASTRIVAPATSTVYAVKCVNGACESNVNNSVVTVNATSTSCVEHWERIDYSTPVKSGTNLFFVKNNPQYGYELWKADLNMNNATMVKNINAKKKSFQATNGVTMNGIRYFTATDNFSEFESSNSTDLWRTDGTTSGTYKVKDINPEATIGIIRDLITVGNLLYFNAEDGVSNGVWRSDGTPEGTYKILNNIVMSGAQTYYNYYYYNNILYFAGSTAGEYGKLCKTDGTVAGTVVLKNGISDCSFFTELNGIIYFNGNENISGPELWKTNGTAAGTSLVKDIYPGGSGGLIGGITVFNGRLFFTGYTNNYGNEPWVSDGTTAGTNILKDIRPGTIGSGGNGFSPKGIINGYLYFSADDGGTLGTELWRTDGTSAGTVLFKDLVTGAVASYPQPLFETIGTKSYFTSYHGSTAMWSLWETDGTSAGTIFKFNIGSGSGGRSAYLYTINNNLYCNYDNYTFRVNPAINGLITLGLGRMLGSTIFNGYTYYTTNSDPNKIRRVSLATNADEAFIIPVSVATSFSGGYVYNGQLHFFGGADNGNNQAISFWKSDGTVGGSTIYFTNENVKDGNAFVPNNSFWNKDVNGTFYFNPIEKDGSPNDIWKTDGTEAGTTKLITNAHLQISESINNDLYFINNGTLFKTNGTTTIALKSNSSYLYSGSLSQAIIINHNSELYFKSTNDAVNGSEIWKTDGTVAGTVLLKDINPGSGGIDISGSKSIGNKLFFSVSDGGPLGLWVTDGTSAGTILLKLGAVNLRFANPVVLNNTLYFYLQTTNEGRGLWKSDGTVAGTVLVKSTCCASNLFIFNNRIFFQSQDANFDSELWVSDGTGLGTKLFKDINVGANSSLATPFAIRGGYLYISTTGMVNSLYKSDGTPEGTFPVLYQTDFNGYEVEGQVYQDVPTFSKAQNFKLSTNPLPAPNIVSAYDVVSPNTSISLYNTNSFLELVWKYRNTTLINGNSNISPKTLIDVPPVTTTYSLVQRDKVCQSAPAFKTITIFSCPPFLSLSSTSTPLVIFHQELSQKA